jgi:hypothetical protein
MSARFNISNAEAADSRREVSTMTSARQWARNANHSIDKPCEMALDLR